MMVATIVLAVFSTDQGTIFPAGLKYEAKNLLVQGNMVVDASKHALNAYGAVDSLIMQNSLANVSKVSVINAKHGQPRLRFQGSATGRQHRLEDLLADRQETAPSPSPPATA